MYDDLSSEVQVRYLPLYSLILVIFLTCSYLLAELYFIPLCGCTELIFRRKRFKSQSIKQFFKYKFLSVPAPKEKKIVLNILKSFAAGLAFWEFLFDDACIAYFAAHIESGDQKPNHVGWTLDEYEESDPMIPFTVSIVVGVLKSIEMEDATSKVQIRMWADETNIELMKFANEIALHAYQFYVDFFKFPYTLQKLDIVALPNSSANKKQGNIGLILMSSSHLTYSAQSASESETFLKVSEICHELCHQWIGNYVTMSSWNEMWLQESVTIVLEQLCVSKKFPEWNYRLSDYIENTFMYVLKRDIGKMSKPLRNGWSNTSTPFSLGKGYVLVRMIRFFLGDDLFQKSLTHYLHSFKFSNASINDLWDTFTWAASNSSILPGDLLVKDIMNFWIDQSGYPLLTVTRNHNPSTLILKQERFKLLEETNKENNQEDECWAFPLSYKTKKEFQSGTMAVNVRGWMTCDGSSKIDIDLGYDEWVIFNLNLNALVRINYDNNNWELIQKTLLRRDEFFIIDELTRAQLMSDMFELGKAGILSYKLIIDTMEYLIHEQSYFPWKEVMQGFEEIRRFLFGTSIFESYRKFVRNILEPVFNRPIIKKIYDFSELDYSECQLKELIVKSSCQFGLEVCKSKSHKLFQRWQPMTPEDRAKLHTENNNVTLGLYMYELFGATMRREDLVELQGFLDTIKDRPDLQDLVPFFPEIIDRASRNILWLERNEQILSQLLS